MHKIEVFNTPSMGRFYNLLDKIEPLRENIPLIQPQQQIWRDRRESKIFNLFKIQNLVDLLNFPHNGIIQLWTFGILSFVSHFLKYLNIK